MTSPFIEEHRRRIDAIDGNICALIEERAQVCRLIDGVKRSEGHIVGPWLRDAAREESILTNFRRQLSVPEPYAVRFGQAVLDVSYAAQYADH